MMGGDKRGGKSRADAQLSFHSRQPEDSRADARLSFQQTLEAKLGKGLIPGLVAS